MWTVRDASATLRRNVAVTGVTIIPPGCGMIGMVPAGSRPTTADQDTVLEQMRDIARGD